MRAAEVHVITKLQCMTASFLRAYAPNGKLHALLPQEPIYSSPSRVGVLALFNKYASDDYSFEIDIFGTVGAAVLSSVHVYDCLPL